MLSDSIETENGGDSDQNLMSTRQIVMGVSSDLDAVARDLANGFAGLKQGDGLVRVDGAFGNVSGEFPLGLLVGSRFVNTGNRSEDDGDDSYGAPHDDSDDGYKVIVTQ